jgi:integrase
MKKWSLTFWNATKGMISKERCDALREHVSARYTDVYAPRKVLNFATAFLKYLAKTHFDTRYQAFDLFLDIPKGLKVRKHVTSRIVTKADVENVLSAIAVAYRNGEIDLDHCLHYRAIVLFGALTGQRSQATVARLTVGQFRAAISRKKPVLDILPEQDKIRMQHYCPIHPQTVPAITSVLDGGHEEELMFKHLSFDRWLRQRKIMLVRCNAHFVPGDLRKFCEQMGDVLQWDQSNKNYIMTHGVSGVDWRFYKHPLPEHVYDIYMRYRADVRF